LIDYILLSSNGRTCGFGPQNRGSNPWGRTMRDIIIKYYRGAPLTLDECVQLMEAYMRKINKTNHVLIQAMLEPTNVFGQHMLQTAVEVSIRSLSEDYTITKLISKEGNLLKVY
jgi:hypothetical protein